MLFKMNFLLSVITILSLNACTTQTFYIVRHAEKENESESSGLSREGIERGMALEKYMADKKLDTVFTSEKRRAVLTGLSVSLPQSLPQVTLEQSPALKLENFIARLKNISGNKNILIVGHTNTIPSIIQSICGRQIMAIPETDYGFIYTITVKGTQITLAHSRYSR